MFNPKEQLMISCIQDIMDNNDTINSDQACTIVSNITPYTYNELSNVWAFWVECD